MAALLEPAGSVGAAGTRTFTREDLHGVMHRMNLAETPFISLVGTDTDLGKVQFDWNVDKFDNPKGAQGHADGVDNTAYESAGKDRRRMANLGQVFERTPQVGFIANAIGTTPGVTNEMVAAVEKKLMELKTDIEAGMCSLDQAAYDDNGTSGSITSGLGALTERTNSNSSLTASAGKLPSTYLPPAAANLGGTVLTVGGDPATLAAGSALNSTNFNASSLRDLMAALRGVTKRARTYDALVGTSIRAAVSALVDPAVTTASNSSNTLLGAATRVGITLRQEEDTAINSLVDVYRNENGELRFITSDLLGTTCTDGTTVRTTGVGRASFASRVFTQDVKAGFVLCKELWRVRYGQMAQVTNLPDGGGGPKKTLRAYAGLYCANPSASGRIWYS